MEGACDGWRMVEGVGAGRSGYELCSREQEISNCLFDCEDQSIGKVSRGAEMDATSSVHIPPYILGELDRWPFARVGSSSVG